MQKLLIVILSSALTVCCLATPATAAISCTLSMTNISFGSAVNVLSGAAVSTTGTATINCSGASSNTSYVFCTNIAAGSDASGNQRRMVSGSNFVNFDLYQNSAHTTEWGNYTNSYLGGGNQTSFTSNSSGNISNKTITVYAVLDGSQQTAIPGSYSETMSGSSSNELQYGSTSGNCPTGSHTSQYSFTVSATLVAGCNVSATTLNFGSSGVLASAVNQTSTVTATCTSTTPYNIGLNAGNGSGSTVTTRKMTGSGGATINYSLYSNSTRTTNWGNTVGTDTVAGTGSGVAQNYTVYGQVPAQTTPAPATYSDTVVVTVTF